MNFTRLKEGDIIEYPIDGVFTRCVVTYTNGYQVHLRPVEDEASLPEINAEDLLNVLDC